MYNYALMAIREIIRQIYVINAHWESIVIKINAIRNVLNTILIMIKQELVHYHKAIH